MKSITLNYRPRNSLLTIFEPGFGSNRFKTACKFSAVSPFSQCFSFLPENPITYTIPSMCIQLKCCDQSSIHFEHFFTIISSIGSQKPGKNVNSIPSTDCLFEMCFARHDEWCSLLFLNVTSALLIGLDFSTHLRTVSIIEICTISAKIQKMIRNLFNCYCWLSLSRNWWHCLQLKPIFWRNCPWRFFIGKLYERAVISKNSQKIETLNIDWLDPLSC